MSSDHVRNQSSFLAVQIGHTRRQSEKPAIREGPDKIIAQMGITAHTFRQSLLEGIHSVAFGLYMHVKVTDVVVYRKKKRDLKREIKILPSTSAHLAKHCMKWV